MNLYEEILTGLRSFDSEFIFYGVDIERIAAAFQEVLKDHPELFWVKNGYASETVTRGNEITVTFRPKIIGDKQQNRRKAAALEQAAASILRGAGKYSSEWDRALYLHDYIVNTSDYDTAAARAYGINPQGNQYADSFTAYGALVEHRAVCAGYAKAFQLLAQRAGLECHRVTGRKNDGAGHEWNVVRVGRNYYHVDTTWDDPVFEGAEKSICQHDFFCVTTREILMTHVLDPGQDLPACNDEKGDYYHKKGLYLSSYSFDAVDRIVTERLASGQVEIKFGSPSELKRALDDLFGNRAVFRIRGIAGRYTGVSYGSGAAGTILRLEVNR